MVARQREIIVRSLPWMAAPTSARGGGDVPLRGDHVQPLRRVAIGYLGGRGAAFKITNPRAVLAASLWMMYLIILGWHNRNQGKRAGGSRSDVSEAWRSFLHLLASPRFGAGRHEATRAGAVVVARAVAREEVATVEATGDGGAGGAAVTAVATVGEGSEAAKGVVVKGVGFGEVDLGATPPVQYIRVKP